MWLIPFFFFWFIKTFVVKDETGSILSGSRVSRAVEVVCWMGGEFNG